MKTKNTQLTGIAGTYFAAAELTQKKYIATVTSRNTEGIDILASNRDGSKTVSIQVKTREPEYSGLDWILPAKGKINYSPSLFYVFVKLKSTNEKPDFYVVPSKIVAKDCATNPKKWKTEWRWFAIDEKDTSKFLNKWSKLGLG